MKWSLGGYSPLAISGAAKTWNFGAEGAEIVWKGGFFTQEMGFCVKSRHSAGFRVLNVRQTTHLGQLWEEVRLHGFRRNVNRNPLLWYVESVHSSLRASMLPKCLQNVPYRYISWYTCSHRIQNEFICIEDNSALISLGTKEKRNKCDGYCRNSNNKSISCPKRAKITAIFAVTHNIAVPTFCFMNKYFSSVLNFKPSAFSNLVWHE